MDFGFQPGQIWDVEMKGRSRVASRWVAGNQKQIGPDASRGFDTIFSDVFKIEWDIDRKCWILDYDTPVNSWSVRGIKERVKFLSPSSAEVKFYWYRIRLGSFDMKEVNV